MPEDDDTAADATLRPIQNATDAVARAKAGVLRWLPTAKRCEACGARCRASWAYDQQVAAFHAETQGRRPAWECPNEECGKTYRREASSRLSFDIWE